MFACSKRRLVCENSGLMESEGFCHFRPYFQGGGCSLCFFEFALPTLNCSKLHAHTQRGVGGVEFERWALRGEECPGVEIGSPIYGMFNTDILFMLGYV